MNNIRDERVLEFPQESWNDTEEKLYLLFRGHLGIENISIERAHWIEKRVRTKIEPRIKDEQ